MANDELPLRHALPDPFVAGPATLEAVLRTCLNPEPVAGFGPRRRTPLMTSAAVRSPAEHEGARPQPPHGRRHHEGADLLSDQATERTRVEFMNSDQDGGGNIRSLPGSGGQPFSPVHEPGRDPHEVAPAVCCCGSKALVVFMGAVATVRVQGDQPVRVTFRYDVPGVPTAGCLSCGLTLAADGTLSGDPPLRAAAGGFVIVDARSPFEAAQGVGRTWEGHQHSQAYGCSDALASASCSCGSPEIDVLFQAQGSIHLQSGLVVEQEFVITGTEPAAASCPVCGPSGPQTPGPQPVTAALDNATLFLTGMPRTSNG